MADVTDGVASRPVDGDLPLWVRPFLPQALEPFSAFVFQFVERVALLGLVQYASALSESKVLLAFNLCCWLAMWAWLSAVSQNFAARINPEPRNPKSKHAGIRSTVLHVVMVGIAINILMKSVDVLIEELAPKEFRDEMQLRAEAAMVPDNPDAVAVPPTGT